MPTFNEAREASEQRLRERSRPRPARPAPQPSGGVKATLSEWLQHPLASEYLVLVPVALLVGIGTVMIWSASSVYAASRNYGSSNYFLWRQLIFVGIGTVAVIVVQRMQLETLKRWAWALFAGALLLTCLTFTPMGFEQNGNRNWLRPLGRTAAMVSLQPAELLKLALVLWAASLFTAKRRVLDEPRHLLVPLAPGVVAAMGLVVLQHDLGTAMLIGLIFVALLWSVGCSGKLLLGLAGIAATGVVLLALTQSSRFARILGFLDPTADPSGTNYQPNQAQYGLATGGWWGVGLGYGRMKWGFLSEAHTDYILAIIGEELGLMGTLLILGLLLLLGYAGFRISLRSGTFFGRIVAAGIASWLMIQALMNVFVVLRLLPVIGVPLPLVSYGGSSLVVNLMAVGVLLICAREEPDAKKYRAARARARQPRGRLSAVLPASAPVRKK